MRRIAARYVVLVMFTTLAFLGGCTTVGFDPNDISITGPSATIVDTNLNWSVTVTSAASRTADLDLQIKLRIPGSAINFYTSPTHGELLGSNETKTFTYTDTGVSVPAGTTSYEYEISFSAFPR